MDEKTKTPDLDQLLIEIDALGKAMASQMTAEEAVRLAAELIYRGVGIMLARRLTSAQCVGVTKSIMDTLIEIRGTTH